ncbi:MAG TPA: Xaa-Pro peptidase family protein [Bacillota bacterium]
MDLRAAFDELEVDGLLTFHPPNRRYLSGFTGTAGYVLITADEVVFITDSRYVEQARQQAALLEVVQHGDDFWETFNEQIRRAGVKRLGFEQEHVSVGWLRRAREHAEAIEWVATEGVVERLRLIKDDDEIAAIARAQALTEQVLAEVLPMVRPGVREIDLAVELEFRMRRRGASGAAFDFIVASGPRSALPHGVASDRMIERGDLVTFDIGCVVGGYCSDLTRTVVVGEPDARQREIHDLVLKAQEAGLAAIRPGRTGREVDAAAREVIAAAGYGDHFGHGLGHGVGLEVHEDPRLSRRGDTTLQPGMVVTVEPGIYIPGWGGVRIEDVVVVRRDGFENLTAMGKGLVFS